MYQDEIIELLDLSQGWGKCCNQIQDAAYETMTPLRWNAFAARQNKDAEECEGEDFVVFNGQYFDWREFDRKAREIVMAYLSYFTEPQLMRILTYLKKGGK